MFRQVPVQYRVRVRCREAPCPASAGFAHPRCYSISDATGADHNPDCIVAAYPRQLQGRRATRENRDEPVRAAPPLSPDGQVWFDDPRNRMITGPGFDGPEPAMKILCSGSPQATAASGLSPAVTPRSLRLARRIMANTADAEEIVQEALLRVWINAPRWRPWQLSAPGSIAWSSICGLNSQAAGAVCRHDVPDPIDPAPERRGADGAREVTARSPRHCALPEPSAPPSAAHLIMRFSNAETARASDVGIRSGNPAGARQAHAAATAWTDARHRTTNNDHDARPL